MSAVVEMVGRVFERLTVLHRVWAEHYGLKKQTLRMRLTKGWAVERAVKTPVRV